MERWPLLPELRSTRRSEPAPERAAEPRARATARRPPALPATANAAAPSRAPGPRPSALAPPASLALLAQTVEQLPDLLQLFRRAALHRQRPQHQLRRRALEGPVHQVPQQAPLRLRFSARRAIHVAALRLVAHQQPLV